MLVATAAAGCPEEAQRAGAVDARRLDQLVRAWSGRTGGTGRSRWPRRSAAASGRYSCSSMPRSATTSKVGRMRTSTGSIRVMKISQKKSMRQRKAEVDDGVGRQDRDGDLADRDRQRHDQAVQQHASRPGAPEACAAPGSAPGRSSPPAVRPGSSGIGTCRASRSVVRRGDEGDPDREARRSAHAQISTRCASPSASGRHPGARPSVVHLALDEAELHTVSAMTIDHQDHRLRRGAAEIERRGSRRCRPCRPGSGAPDCRPAAGVAWIMPKVSKKA
jgi:hypothetical protein